MLKTIDRPEAGSNPAQLLDVTELSKLLSCSPRHVWRLRDAGHLPAPILLGRLVRWRKTTIEKWLAEHDGEGQ